MRSIGLDVHHRFIQATVISDNGEITHFRVPTTEAGLTELKERCGPDSKVVFEASTSSFRLYDVLCAHAAEVIVAHPAQTRGASAWHVKTDMRDSETLARLLSTGFIRPVWVPDRERRSLRGLLEYRQRLSRERLVLLNRASAKVREEMLEYPKGLTRGAGDSLACLESMTWPDPDPSQALMVRSVVRVATLVQQELTAIDAALAEWSKAHPQAVLLQSIPGVGPVIAAILVADIGDVARFPTAAKLCAYAGMVPTVYASGKTLHIGHLSHAGRHLLRWALWMATLRLVRSDRQFHAFYTRLSGRRPKRTALVACCRKLLTVVWHMLRTGQEFRRQALPRDKEVDPITK
jgi:transposase